MVIVVTLSIMYRVWNHYVVHLKLTVTLCVNYASIKNKMARIDNQCIPTWSRYCVTELANNLKGDRLTLKVQGQWIKVTAKPDST